jgi:ATP-dependent Clp protease protease subunit
MQDPANPLFATFCAGIDQFSAQKFANCLALATQKKFSELHISIQSTGGMVSDGIYLYHLLRASPIPIIAYNIGSVQSIAAIAFLGASRRVVSKHALFMFHRTSITPQAASGDLLRELTLVADLEDKRTEAILRERTKIVGRDWADMKTNAFWFTADQAVESGIADCVGDFSAPQGAEMWSFTI